MTYFAFFFQDGGGFSIISLLPFVLIFGIFYVLVIMPQRKQQQELKNLIAELKAGDEVVTNGGVIGKIIEVRDSSFFIRSADKSILEVSRTAVVGKRPDGEVK
jgi:preprotein translocase subunit YajC